jgi:capsular polysaccharide biosynthesis protein
MVTAHGGAGVIQLGRHQADDDRGTRGRRPAELPPADLPTLRFFRHALRRGAWQWCLIAAAGLLIGLSLSVVLPPADQAATSVLLSHDPSEDPANAILTDVAIARSRPVAVRAMRELGVRQSVSSFIAAYSATPVTDRIILITMGAPSASEAMVRANAVARAFLAVRAHAVRAQLPGVLAVLDQRITVAWRKADRLAVQVTQMSGHAHTLAQQVRFARLKKQERRAANQLNGLQLAASADQVAVVTEVADSQVLDPAAAVTHAHPRLRAVVLYAGIGLIPGLVLGMGFVIVRALLSGRLRRRDDVAYALGAPVGLSVGPLRPRGWRPGRPALAAAAGRDPQRLAGYLRTSVPWSADGRAALAVVAADDPQAPALALASLAISYAEQGRRVVLADLCRGAPAARLVSSGHPGVHRVDRAGGRLTVAVPGPDEVAPTGPWPGPAPAAERPPAELAAACDPADVILTLVQLDPALGAEHLASWASDAVVTVTAGQSSWARIHAVGEMIRLAGVRLASAVLIAADKTDDSLGVVRHAEVLAAPGASQPDQLLGRSDG